MPGSITYVHSQTRSSLRSEPRRTHMLLRQLPISEYYAHPRPRIFRHRAKDKSETLTCIHNHLSALNPLRLGHRYRILHLLHFALCRSTGRVCMYCKNVWEFNKSLILQRATGEGITFNKLKPVSLCSTSETGYMTKTKLTYVLTINIPG